METLMQPLVKAIGWSILNSLWQSACIYFVLFIVMLSFPKLLAKHRHNISFASIGLMFGWFAYTFFTKIEWSLSNQTNNHFNQAQQFYQYLSTVPQSFGYKAEQYFPIIVTTYILGIFLQLFVIAKGYNTLFKLRKNSLIATPTSWEPIFKSVLQRLNINRKVQFHLSELVNIPLVIGFVKPVVLFPVALVNQLNINQVEAILIHELSHIRRNDFLLNLIKTGIETFMFFNPFVWLAGRFIHIEREHACDDLVLKLTEKPIDYAHTLLKLELIKDKTSPAFALAATGKTQNLYQRIKRITNMKTNYLNAKQQMAALTLGIACIACIAWVKPAKKEPISHKIEKAQPIISDILSDKEAAHNALICSLKKSADTVPKKHKITIVLTDDKGNKKEYHTIKEVPDSLKKEVQNIYSPFEAYNLTFGFDSLKMRVLPTELYKVLGKNSAYFKSKDFKKLMDSVKIIVNSEKWKKDTERFKKFNSQEEKAKWEKMVRDMEDKFNSPEWKAEMEELKLNGEKMKKHFDSPEFKKHMEDMKKHFDSPEFKKNMEDMKKHFDSPEFKKHVENMKNKFNSPEFKKHIEGFRIQGDKFKRQFDSPEWKAKIDESKELQNSAEYKKLKEKFEKDVEALKKKQDDKAKSETSKN